MTSFSRPHENLNSISFENKMNDTGVVLVNLDTKEMCGVNNSHDQTIRLCNDSENRFAAVLAQNTYDSYPQVALAPAALLAIKYYLVCTSVQVGTAVVIHNVPMIPNVENADSWLFGWIGAFTGAAVGATVCLPATGVNYGLIYLKDLATGKSKSK